ncbi:glyoxal reductase-like [Ylistrum balloti]|uniref:glyoxal reductase-like n=1 Tax=Ylistrum balloti TaxID=509963 RepID=UPI002905AD04|nr:glyoxal reductase-like [Ylistrum balloti]
MKEDMSSIAKDLTSRVKLNDGVTMPLFGLGMYLSGSGQGGQAEHAVIHAVSTGYKLLDTAEFYGNEADVGRGIKNGGVKREDLFVVTKLWENGYDRCKKIFNKSLKMLDIGYVDLYLIHSPSTGKCVETYKAMLELKQEGLVRSVGVSNFGVHHLERLREAGLPTPSVNQIELHPWQQKKDIVEYCRQNGITVMGYSPLTKGQKLSDKSVLEIAKRHNKSPAQILIRWSVEHGFITIPKSSDPGRIEQNTDVFSWSLDQDALKILNGMPDWSCSWNPCITPWRG